MPLRVRRAAALLWPSARALPRVPLTAAGALAPLLALLAVRVDPPSGQWLLTVLRVDALVLCVGAAFGLDDTAAVSTAAAPTPLLTRRLLRGAMVAVACAGPWLAALGLAVREPLPAGTTLPLALLTLEAASLLACTLAIAAGVARSAHLNAPGSTAASLLLGAVTASALLPSAWSPWIPLDQAERWARVQPWWAIVLLSGLGWFAWWSRDAYQPGQRPRGRGTSRPHRLDPGVRSPVQRLHRLDAGRADGRVQPGDEADQCPDERR